MTSDRESFLEDVLFSPLLRSEKNNKKTRKLHLYKISRDFFKEKVIPVLPKHLQTAQLGERSLHFHLFFSPGQNSPTRIFSRRICCTYSASLNTMVLANDDT